MHRISEETGVALGTLYSWFESKDLLLLEVMARWMTDVCSELRLRPVTGTTAAERVNVRLEQALDLSMAEPVRFRACVRAFTVPETGGSDAIGRMEMDFRPAALRGHGGRGGFVRRSVGAPGHWRRLVRGSHRLGCRPARRRLRTRRTPQRRPTDPRRLRTTSGRRRIAPGSAGPFADEDLLGHGGHVHA